MQIFRISLAVLGLALSGPSRADPEQRCAVSQHSGFEAAGVLAPVRPTPSRIPAAELLGVGAPSTKDATQSQDIRTLPIIEHIEKTGAVVSDLGTAHGVRNAVARRGDHFLLISIAPDGDAAVAGVQSDLSFAALESIAAANITDLGVAHGLHGLFIRDGKDFQVAYLTPDNERIIQGVMWDDTGQNVTRRQIAPIAGTIPTVEIDRLAVPRSTGGAPNPRIAILGRTNFGLYGTASAPRLWMFIDPQCSFSIRAFEQLQPFVNSGKVQLAVIPLSVLDYEDHGLSTKNALRLLSQDPDQIVAAWSSGEGSGVVNPAASERLGVNMLTAQSIGLKGTPTFIWQRADGSEGRINGIPADIGSMVASIGS